MNYVEIIGHKHPTVQVSCNGNPEVYAEIHWEGGDPLPVEDQLIADSVDLLRDDIWEAIKAERDRREQEDGTPVAGKWFHSDDASKIKQITLVKLSDMGALPPNLQWKTMDGSFITMTPTIAYGIMTTAALISTKIFAAAEVHRASMMARSDPTFYDFSTGWPPSYQDYVASLSTP